MRQTSGCLLDLSSKIWESVLQANARQTMACALLHDSESMVCLRELLSVSILSDEHECQERRHFE